MGWAAVRDAVQQAVVLASGLSAGQVIWKFQNADEPPVSYIALSFSSLMEVGIDHIEYSTDLTRPAGQEIAISSKGMREMALDVECFTASTADDADALALGEQVRSSLLLPSIRSVLSAVGVAPFDLGQLGYVPEVVNIGFRGRSTFSVRCYVPAQAAVEYAGYIATVSGTIASSGGAQPGSTTVPFNAP